MKIKNFLKDVGGASRVTKNRLKAFAEAPPALTDRDPIADVAREWHPGKLELCVTKITPACKTAKTIRLERVDGEKLPFFYAGQYIVLDFSIRESVASGEDFQTDEIADPVAGSRIVEKLISRPYSLSSAPFEARAERPFVEITVRRSKGDGFICDYVNDEVKVGDILTGTMGMGQFYYEPLRDAGHVVALAGGVGITPFVSMAREVASGALDIDLTILYGSVSSDDIVLKEELDALDAASDRVHVVHVLSGDEPSWTGERGFLTADLIAKYSYGDITAGDTSYFICGPQVMYGFLRGELAKLEIPARRIRFEVFGQAKDITAFEGYPQELRDKTFTVTVVRGISETEIPAKATESLVVAFERAGIRIETGCRSGECGFCRTKVLSGDYFVCPESDGRRGADKDFNYVHACAAYPLSDMRVKIPIV